MPQTMSTPKIVEEAGWGTLEIFDLESTEELLQQLLTDLFTNHWEQIHFGYRPETDISPDC
jgi:muconolactone delta-isomerase